MKPRAGILREEDDAIGLPGNWLALNALFVVACGGKAN